MNNLVLKSLRYFGFAKLFRFLFQRNQVTILLFHEMDVTTAEKTFNYLSKNYNIIDLNDYIEAHKNKDYSRIPPYALIITFDDGHKGNYDILPVVKKYEIPITIFLCASIIDTHKKFWFRYEKIEKIKSELKEKNNRERLAILEKNGFTNEKEFETRQALTRAEIEEMSPYINMQSHTCYHPILPRCSDNDAKEEIVKSKEILESEYGFSINTLAYPNGDYSDRDIELIKDAGYSCAITVDFGFNTLNSDIFRLKRVAGNNTKDIDEIVVKSSGLWAFLKFRNGKKQPYGYAKSIKDYP